MRPSARRLVLNRETVRALSGRELELVIGGGDPTPGSGDGNERVPPNPNPDPTFPIQMVPVQGYRMNYTPRERPSQNFICMARKGLFFRF